MPNVTEEFEEVEFGVDITYQFSFVIANYVWVTTPLSYIWKKAGFRSLHYSIPIG